MYVKELVLKNYRNYENETCIFDNKLNILFGANAQGKTNLVEAIYYASIGKSFKTVKDNNLIRQNAQNGKIFLKVQKEIGEITIEVNFALNSKKNIKVNDANLDKIVNLYGNLVTVFFSPDDLKLVKEAPQDRRKFIDIALSQLSKRYLNLLIKYQKILNERNALLKNKSQDKTVLDTIYVWNEQLSDTAKDIIYQRLEFVKKIEEIAKRVLLYLSDNKEDLEIKYTGINLPSTEEIKKELLRLYEERFEKDYTLGYTTVGPHRDDIDIFLNGKEVKTFASQGQQRTIALSLKLAEKELIKQKIKEEPILILDDVFSELDDKRKQKLIKLLRNGQTFITTTERVDNQNYIEINQGKIVK